MRLSDAIKLLQNAQAQHGDQELRQWMYNNGKLEFVPMLLEVADEPNVSVMRFEVVSQYSVQLYKEDGTVFSSPITTGEAGLFHKLDDGFYYYPDDSKNDSDPSIA
jgi:hypothetical protein